MSATRLFMYRILAGILLIILFPLWIILYIVVKVTSPGPFIFSQTRWGRNKKPFTLYKIRTMVVDAEQRKKKLLSRNEVEPPAFKIAHDPRFTALGHFLSRTGIDELPQLLNIVKGEMSFVGPRPLPVNEAKKIPAKYDARFSTVPGITSSWAVQGSHALGFAQWMKLDIEYGKSNNLRTDLDIMLRTMALIIRKLVWPASIK